MSVPRGRRIRDIPEQWWLDLLAGPVENSRRCRDQDEAWRRARLVVDDVRQRYAGSVVDVMRTHTERVPL